MITPAQCNAKAEAALGAYVSAAGAHGDAEAMAKVLEMLISKAALGIAMTNGKAKADEVLKRTSKNVRTVMKGSSACAS